MISIISAVAAALITVPFVGYIAAFVFAKQVTKNHRRSVHLAMDVSTFLFIVSVHFLIIAIWHKSFFLILLLFMLGIALLVTVIHYKAKGEIIFSKVLKGFWRVNFAFFFFCYIILTVIGILYRVSWTLAS
ncbi:DUF3397 domain-containing protein [Peribacillus sp. B-H-3]|jgi:hypothetical protein|uniref:DUF3397 domain-containing protein n=1 Tax=Peribacillus sp. B-H-3 TaxID=3400420 RepID=UPI003B01148E